MAEGPRIEGVYEFGDFRLLAAERQLTRRSGGRPIQLTQKALDALHFLVQRAGRFEQAREIIVGGLPPQMGDSAGLEAVRRLITALETQQGAAAAVAALDAVRMRLAGNAWSQFMKRRFILWYTELGALDQSFDVATEALDHFSRSGTVGVAWAFLWMREMLPFRRDPRFQVLCRRMKLFDFWEVNGPPDHCELSAGTLVCH